MTEKGEPEANDGMQLSALIKQGMSDRKIESHAELARRLSAHLDRPIERNTPNAWISKRRTPGSNVGLEVDLINALAAVLAIPADAIVLADAKARGVTISGKATIAGRIPSYADQLPKGDIDAWLLILHRLGKAHGHVR